MSLVGEDTLETCQSDRWEWKAVGMDGFKENWRCCNTRGSVEDVKEMQE